MVFVSEVESELVVPEVAFGDTSTFESISNKSPTAVPVLEDIVLLSNRGDG